MRMLGSLVLYASFALPFLVPACGGSTTSQEAYDTLVLCYTDHTKPSGEGLTPANAITVCCFEHPIGTPPVANTVCGETAAACTTYVTAQLSAEGVSAADVTAACTDYLSQRTP